MNFLSVMLTLHLLIFTFFMLIFSARFLGMSPLSLSHTHTDMYILPMNSHASYFVPLTWRESDASLVLMLLN